MFHKINAVESHAVGDKAGIPLLSKCFMMLEAISYMLKYFRDNTGKKDWSVVAWLIMVSLFKDRCLGEQHDSSKMH